MATGGGGGLGRDLAGRTFLPVPEFTKNSSSRFEFSSLTNLFRSSKARGQVGSSTSQMIDCSNCNGGCGLRHGGCGHMGEGGLTWVTVWNELFCRSFGLRVSWRAHSSEGRR